MIKCNIPVIEDAKVIRFMTDPKYKIARHSVLLVGLLILLAFSREVTVYQGHLNYVKIFFVYVPIVFFCYLNMNLLVPRLFFRGRYVAYFSVLILMAFLSLSLISTSVNNYYPDSLRDRNRDSYEGVIILTAIILITTLIRLFQHWILATQKINELNAINFNLELNELRNQINPHFLFNMLNGIKLLVRTDQDKATAVIMKLSEFLRYQLYEDSKEKVLLLSDLIFLSNFLELEKLRRDNLTAEINWQIGGEQEINRIFVPPNLFITFVENAVKHSVDINGDESNISIFVTISLDHINFSCKNSKDPRYRPSTNRKSSGLGLENIKRRLQLMYGDNYTLNINSTDNLYSIDLAIPYEMYNN
ncbi:sensor histidine kinase [Sphingobacterium multivorum]|uniref:sensor histidine kinase n=2 Tax=Bacteroidota TaxID=976 RepID=UPI0028A79BE2|nr:histidine kinase [Sphingobacterium multivorum]